VTIRTGISGWTYPPWRGVFYPPKLPQKQELAYAARRLTTIEINGTFYSLQRPESFAAWAEAVPADFVFAVKAPRYLTHILRLKDFAGALPNFLASGMLRLGPKLGPVLWQLPPYFRFEADRLGAFVAALPHDTEAAADLASHHDQRMAGRAWTQTDAARPLRHAIEVRHESFRTRAFTDLLAAHDVALVCADSLTWPRLGDVTADFVYARLHGAEELYASGYDDASLGAWAARVRTWAAGGRPDDLDHVGAAPPDRKRDVFVYFDNDAKVRAPADAQALAARLGVGPPANVEDS
jgi:uncharacterized protein YecE (DUF72 family)